jgi:glycine/D-amino acid oxidase-like deaminating enzyme
MASIVERPTAARAATEPRRRVYWHDTVDVEPGPPLRGDVRCDVCVVGGGYTGMWAAHFIKKAEPALDVRIVEGAYAGAGASGHNDGFVTPTIGHSLSSTVRRFGAEGAKVAYAAVSRSILELARFCDRNGIDADLERGGFCVVATNGGQMRRLAHELELARRLGASLELLDASEARTRVPCGVIEGALKSAGALVNPMKLARGLARVVRDQGVVIHERTPALRLRSEGATHTVTTPGGRVTAPRVVLAANAYQHAFRPLRRPVAPVWSYALVTEPLSDEQLAEVGWASREGFVEARNFIVFGRLTAENRLLVGGGPAPYFHGGDMDERHLRNDGVADRLRGELARFFPALRGHPVSHSYGGCIAVTRDLVPHVGRLRHGVHYAHGYCGNGIAMTHTVGKVLRDLVLERDTDYASLPLVARRERRLPPEPLTFVGARLLSAALAWQDDHPGVLSRPLL